MRVGCRSDGRITFRSTNGQLFSLQDGHANLHDSEIVCLEIGETCTGSLCPIGAAPPAVMAARLVRNELKTVVQPAVSAMCPSCEKMTDHFLVGTNDATCAVCGVTTHRD